MILNGRCTDTPQRMQMMNFLLERAFGLVLGLGTSQYAPHSMKTAEMWGWPVMQPASGICSFYGGNCIPNPGALRFDDVASLNRMYPVNADNLAGFSGKALTASSTVSIQGTISFRQGMGMQGVNVVARPLDANGHPMDSYAVTFVSGSFFRGWRGSDVTGWTDRNGGQLDQWGSTDPALQGFFDLGAMPVPPNMTQAAYQLTFEGIDPLFIYNMTVGPYIQGSPRPSGTLAPVTTAVIAPGGSQTVNINVADSALTDSNNAISTEQMPRMLPPGGMWCGRLSQPGQTDWFLFPVRNNRAFTIVTLALGENGQPANDKAMPAIGVWDAFLPIGSPSVGTSPGLNGYAAGESWLRVDTSGDDVARVGIADMRGDGRPDYAYTGWVIYADSVEPQRIPLAGGPIVIRGMGFHTTDTVKVGGVAAQVTSVSPNEITAIAPAASKGVTGSVDVEVDDLPVYFAQTILYDGISYDAGTADSLALVTAPANTIPTNVPVPFTVTALGTDLKPAGGVTVTFAIANGSATLGCGKSSCSLLASGDGTASMNIIATDATPSVVTASLLNGASLQAHFSGGAPPAIAAVTPSISVAAGSSVAWTAQALVLNNGSPAAGQTVTWKAGSGIKLPVDTTGLSGTAGVASQQLGVGPLTPGQQAVASACVNGTSQCASFTANAARPEYAWLEAVAGTSQSLPAGASASQVVLRVRDMNGSPMAGGIVTIYQAVYAWAPPCPPHGRCAQPELLATQASTVASALDGSVSFAPAVIPGVATRTLTVAATGNSSTLNVLIEQQP
jgi:hypothetical protein